MDNYIKLFLLLISKVPDKDIEIERWNEVLNSDGDTKMCIKISAKRKAPTMQEVEAINKKFRTLEDLEDYLF